MPRTSKLTIAARVLLVPYFIAVGLTVWLPASEASKITNVVFRAAQWVSVHFDLSYSTVARLFEFGANVVLFVPFGMLLLLALARTHAWVVILLGYAATVTIELVQTQIPGRFTTISDVIANTLGTVIGCLLVRLFVQRKRDYVIVGTAPATPDASDEPDLDELFAAGRR